MAGSFALALMLGACAALQKQQPAEPPPLTLVTHAEAQAEPTPAPPTGCGDPGAATRGSPGSDQRARQEREVADVQDGPPGDLRV